MRLRLNDQAVLYIEFMVEQHPEKHSSFLPFLCQRYAITGALQLSTTFLQLLKREGRHKRTRDEWKKFHEPRIVQALKPYRAAWSRMKGAEFCSRQWSRWTKKFESLPCLQGFLHDYDTEKLGCMPTCAKRMPICVEVGRMPQKSYICKSFTAASE